jgi:hypothetical protein
MLTDLILNPCETQIFCDNDESGLLDFLPSISPEEMAIALYREFAIPILVSSFTL